jgi:hypothetical protein
VFGGGQRLLKILAKSHAKATKGSVTAAQGARGIPVSVLAECARAQHDGKNRGSMQVHKVGVVLSVQEEDGRRT